MSYEILCRHARIEVTIRVIPSHTTIPLQRLSVIIVHVQSYHLRSVESLTYTTKAATRPTSKAHIIDIVRRNETHHTELVIKVSRHSTFRISVLSTNTKVDV